MSDNALIEKYFSMEETVYNRICARFYNSKSKKGAAGHQSLAGLKEEAASLAEDIL